MNSKYCAKKENEIHKDQNGNVFICFAINGIGTMTRYEVPIYGIHGIWKYENAHVCLTYSKCKDNIQLNIQQHIDFFAFNQDRDLVCEKETKRYTMNINTPSNVRKTGLPN